MMGKCGKEEQKKKGENRMKTAVRVLFKFVFCLLNGRNLTFFFFLTDIKKTKMSISSVSCKGYPVSRKVNPVSQKAYPFSRKAYLIYRKAHPVSQKAYPVSRIVYAGNQRLLGLHAVSRMSTKMSTLFPELIYIYLLKLGKFLRVSYKNLWKVYTTSKRNNISNIFIISTKGKSLYFLVN